MFAQPNNSGIAVAIVRELTVPDPDPKVIAHILEEEDEPTTVGNRPEGN